MKKILFVCLGNICRSAMAEAIANKIIQERGLTQEVMVDSAGMANYHEGEGADPRMIKAGKARGYDVTSISRPVRYEDFDYFDLILPMDQSNRRDLYQMAPTLDASRKIKMMADYCHYHPECDYIPDPYFGGKEGFDHVIDLLEDAVSEMIAEEVEGHHRRKK